MALCRNLVGPGVIGQQCELQEGHDGPHMTQSNPASVATRQRWESGAEARATLAEFHEPPQTFGQLRGEAGEDTHQADRVHPSERKRIAAEQAIANVPVAESVLERQAQQVASEGPLAPPPPSTPPPWAQRQERPAGQVIMEEEVAPSDIPPMPDPFEGVEGQPTRATPRDDQDQPLPRIRPGVTSIQDLVRLDLDERERIGIERYGTPLQAFNRRDMTVDAYQELMDLLVYMRGWMEERIAAVDQLVAIREFWITRVPQGDAEGQRAITGLDQVIGWLLPDPPTEGG
jgi:hypothetical protein